MIGRSTPLALTLLLLATTASAQEADEPGMARPGLVEPAPPRPTPNPISQVIDIEGPNTAPPRVPAPVVVAQAKPLPEFGPVLKLDVGFAYGGFAGIIYSRVHGPMFTGSGAITFGRGTTKHGFRVGGFFGRMSGEGGIYGGEIDAKVYGINMGYTAQFGCGLWLATGLGVLHLQDAEDSDDSVNVPEATFSIGYDIALGRYLALRLAGEMGTLAVSWRGSASAGLVLRL